MNRPLLLLHRRIRGGWLAATLRNVGRTAAKPGSENKAGTSQPVRAATEILGRGKRQATWRPWSVPAAWRTGLGRLGAARSQSRTRQTPSGSTQSETCASTPPPREREQLQKISILKCRAKCPEPPGNTAHPSLWTMAQLPRPPLPMPSAEQLP